ncbi:hypothetical protein F5884DRAFT_102332 [Xylogone sp. PMI_703]|nr:hypothetical protein F5884DRAFT_102332 [Xylogone sp. PMI_703]
MSGARNDNGKKATVESDSECDCCSGGEWMKQQDKRILRMKREGKSWMDIAVSVGRPKGEVRARYKELLVEEEEKKKKKKEAAAAAAANAKALEANLENDPEFAAFMKLYKGGSDGPKGGNKNRSVSVNNNNGANNNNDDDDWGPSTPTSWTRRAYDLMGANNDDDGGWGPSTPTERTRVPYEKLNNPSPRSPAIHQRASSPFAHSKPYPSWDQHVWNQRPTTKFLRPNFIWSQEDCEVLEMLEEQYVEQKWLQLQAKFFNWTGRMIPAEIIQKKFEEDRGH